MLSITGSVFQGAGRAGESPWALQGLPVGQGGTHAPRLELKCIAGLWAGVGKGLEKPLGEAGLQSPK